MEDIVKLVGERIRYLRNERNWSQEELAHRADIHRSHLGQIERGEINVTVESVAKIAAAFEMTLEEVFSDLQPSYENRKNVTLATLMNRINNLSPYNQQVLLNFMDNLQQWKP